MDPAVRPGKPQAVLHVYLRIRKGGSESFVHGIEGRVRAIEFLFDDGVLRISCHYRGQPFSCVSQQLQRQGSRQRGVAAQVQLREYYSAIPLSADDCFSVPHTGSNVNLTNGRPLDARAKFAGHVVHDTTR
jgi:hypothetical protein